MGAGIIPVSSSGNWVNLRSPTMPGTISFTNRFDHTLDAKNRLMVPQTFRDIVEKAEGEVKFFLTRGFEKCLALYAGSTWEKMRVLLETRKAEEVAEIKSRRFFRLFYSSAVEVTPDKAGRILIPEHLRKVAGLEKKVVLIGVNDRVELWNPEKWETFSEGAAEEEVGEYERSAKEAFRAIV